jgi:hypothetical protein
MGCKSSRVKTICAQQSTIENLKFTASVYIALDLAQFSVSFFTSLQLCASDEAKWQVMYNQYIYEGARMI